MRITQPMLAGRIEHLSQIRYPVMATPKLDGIRCLIVDGRALTRNFKPIPNIAIRDWLERNFPDGFDGELMVNGWNFNDISGIVRRTRGGIPANLFYAVFDYVKDSLYKPYEARIRDMTDWLLTSNSPHASSVSLLTHAWAVVPVVLESEEDLLSYEEYCLDKGYEGVMLRSPGSPYKCGRSTVNEGWLLKLKRFKDGEAEVIRLVARFHNENPQEEDAFGYAKRSKASAGLVPEETLGAFLVRDLETGVEFFVGTGKGLTEEARKQYWEKRESLSGAIIRYRYQEAGAKNAPRFPQFVGFRGLEDMGGE